MIVIFTVGSRLLAKFIEFKKLLICKALSEASPELFIIDMKGIKVTINNLLGKTILIENLKDNSLNISNLNSGIYIVKIEANGNSTARKLVKK